MIVSFDLAMSHPQYLLGLLLKIHPRSSRQSRRSTKGVLGRGQAPSTAISAVNEANGTCFTDKVVQIAFEDR